jgi:DNA-binding CsgD family transcriptional regulator
VTVPRAVKRCQRFRRLAARLDYTGSSAATSLAELALGRGADAEAAGRFAERLAVARGREAPEVLARCLLGLARSLLYGGDAGSAAPSFEEAAQLARRAGLHHVVTLALVGAGQAALARGDAESAWASLDQAPGLARRPGDEVAEAVTRQGHGAGARHERDLGAPTRLLGAAVGLHGAVGDGARVGVTIDALGGGVPVDQHRLVDGGPNVEELSDGISSPDAAAGDTGGVRRRRSSRPSKGWDALTRAERTVAELAARGLTNAQISLELGVATATVKAHLRRVFAKLGVESRARLAAEVYGLRQDEVAAYGQERAPTPLPDLGRTPAAPGHAPPAVDPYAP